MARSLDLRLDDMLAAIALIEDVTAGMSFADYRGSLVARYATERAIEIISEASRSLPDSARAQHPSIRWADIAGIGNILRHEYQRVDPFTMWQTFQDHLPSLKEALEALRDGP